MLNYQIRNYKVLSYHVLNYQVFYYQVDPFETLGSIIELSWSTLHNSWGVKQRKCRKKGLGKRPCCCLASASYGRNESDFSHRLTAAMLSEGGRGGWLI